MVPLQCPKCPQQIIQKDRKILYPFVRTKEERGGQLFFIYYCLRCFAKARVDATTMSTGRRLVQVVYIDPTQLTHL